MTQIPQNTLQSLHKKLGKSTLPAPSTLSAEKKEKKKLNWTNLFFPMFQEK